MGDVHLDLDDIGIDAKHGTAQNLCEHGSPAAEPEISPCSVNGFKKEVMLS
jgi:hypothetical protein